MSEIMTVKTASTLWNLEERRITVLCREGRIHGAMKQDKSWLIPADVEKPVDKRVKTGAYRKEKQTTHLPLPVGISDYRLASTEYYYNFDLFYQVEFGRHKELLQSDNCHSYEKQYFETVLSGKADEGDLVRFHELIPQSTAIYIQQEIYTGNVAEFKNQLEKLLLQSASCYDTVGENFYHGLVLGLCAMLDRHYYITSNREAGEGRYDIQLLPRDNRFPGVLLELKAENM